MIISLTFLTLASFVWYLWEKSHRKTSKIQAGLQQNISLPYEQEWELYHNDFSLCSKKVRVCLDELGINYKSHHIDLIETGSYQNISRAYLKVNPSGLLPVLVHYGHPIYESHEQIRYAVSKNEPNELIDFNDPETQARADHWIERTSMTGDDPISKMKSSMAGASAALTLPIFAAMMNEIPAHRLVEGLLFHRLKQRPLFFLKLKLTGLSNIPKTPPFIKLIKAASLVMQEHMDDLESELAMSEGTWLCGNQFSLADVGLVAIFERLEEATLTHKFITAERPLVLAYWQNLKTRPSYKTAIKQHTHPVTKKGISNIQFERSKNPALDTLLSS